MWVTEYPAAALREGRGVYSPPELAGMEAGLIALYQKCPHLGCRVPSCVTLAVVRVPVPRLAVQPGGREARRPGPARHGPLRHAGRRRRHFIVDTGTVIQGPPIGTNTTGQEAEGPSCIGQAGGALMRVLAARRDRRSRRNVGAHPRAAGHHRLRRLPLRQHPPGPARAGHRARARPEPQAVLRRRALEGPRLDRNLAVGARAAGRHRGRPAPVLAGRAGPPGRRRSSGFEEIFASRGEAAVRGELRGCHGGKGAVGGVAAYMLNDENGDFVANVAWQAPALNTVLLRFDEEEMHVRPRPRPAVLAHAAVGSTVGGGP